MTEDKLIDRTVYISNSERRTGSFVSLETSNDPDSNSNVVMMTPTISLQEIWTSIKNAPLEHVPACLRKEEPSLLYTLARLYYEGKGEIIDAGSFLGGSSVALSKGLAENTNVLNRQKHIYSIDRFHDQDPFYGDYIRKFVDPAYSDSQSFRYLYERHICGYEDLIDVYEGDFMNYSWNSKPIEILFLDICKTQGLAQQVVKVFFSHLMPDKSLVLHQDYYMCWHPYIHIIMEWFHEYFEIVNERVGDTMIFLCKKPVAQSMIQTVLSYSFTADQQLNLLNKAIERVGHDQRPNLFLVRAVLIDQINGRSEAINELMRVREKFNPSESGHAYFENLSMLEAFWDVQPKTVVPFQRI
jgi:hypothetical protein